MQGPTIDDTVDLARPEHRRLRRRRHAGYAATTAVLALLVVGAVLDGAGVDVYGVDTAHATAASGDWELDVRYGTRSRPALATPFDIEVTRTGGFDGPVTIAVSSSYLAMWDENGLDPQPAVETQDGEYLQWTFDPPAGEVLAVSFDARIEPGAQNGEAGRVAVLDEAGRELVAVDVRTTVLP
jgi:hypothetical protein